MVCSGKVCAGLSKTECVALSWVTAFRVNIKPKVIREYGDRAWDIESSGFGTQGSLAPIRGIRYICYESLRKLGIWWDLYLVFDVYRIRYAFPPGNLCLFIHLVYAIPNTRTILVSKCMSTINNSLLSPWLVQGTGNKKWYSAGVGWVDFGHNSGTLQPTCPLIKNMLWWWAPLKLHPLPYSPQPQRLSICSHYHHSQK